MAPKQATKAKASKNTGSPSFPTEQHSSGQAASTSAASSGPMKAQRGDATAKAECSGPPMDLNEMRARWVKPTTLRGRILFFLWASKMRLDFIMGPYFFDWWEALLMYSALVAVTVLLFYGASKQLHHAMEYWQLQRAGSMV